jgi:hypothetical protein
MKNIFGLTIGFVLIGVALAEDTYEPPFVPPPYAYTLPENVGTAEGRSVAGGAYEPPFVPPPYAYTLPNGN